MGRKSTVVNEFVLRLDVNTQNCLHHLMQNTGMPRTETIRRAIQFASQHVLKNNTPKISLAERRRIENALRACGGVEGALSQGLLSPQDVKKYNLT